MSVHRFVVEVDAETSEQALLVMQERLYHDEDYGFAYAIDFRAADALSTPDEER